MRLIKNRKGFTLIELLVALSIIAIGLLAAASMQGIAVNGNSVSNRVSVASELAQLVAEDVLSSSLTGTILTTSGGPYNYMLDPVNGSLTVPGTGTFSAQYWTTTPVIISGATVTGTTQVTVQVSYLNRTAHGTPTPVTTFTTYKRAI